MHSKQLGCIIEFQTQKRNTFKLLRKDRNLLLFFSSAVFLDGNSSALCHTAGQGQAWLCALVSAARSGMWAKDPAMSLTACELCCLLQIPEER